MENASKALIMAGAILIAIMIISLGIMIFNNMSNSTKRAANMDEQEIANFNSKITPYVGQSVSGSQVNALIQLIISIDTNAVNSGEYGKSVSITYPLDSGTNTIAVNEAQQKVTGINATKRVKTGASEFYKVSATYGEDGLIKVINVSQ